MCNCTVSVEFNKLSDTPASPPSSSQQPLLPLLHYFVMFLHVVCCLCHSFVTLSCCPSASPPLSPPPSLPCCGAVDARGLCVYLLRAVRFYDLSARTSSCARRGWGRGKFNTNKTRQLSACKVRYTLKIKSPCSLSHFSADSYNWESHVWLRP